MLIELRHRFPTPPELAFAAMFSEAYEEASAAQVRVERTVLEDRSSEGQRVRRVHVNPEQTFPAPIARILGHDRFSYVIEEQHDLSATRMDWVVVPDAAADKVQIYGSWQLKAVPEGCERVVKINIVVRVPVVGGRIERQIGAELRSNYEIAAEFAQRWLAEHA